MSGKMGRELVLRKALKGPRQSYDVILIDCPPALGLLTVNALVAADHALISAEAQYFALQGVEQALEVIELARESLNPDLGADYLELADELLRRIGLDAPRRKLKPLLAATG